MSLRNKIVLILATVAVLYVTVDVVLMRAMVAEPFRVLEEEEAFKDVERVRASLDGAVEDLQLRTRTLAHLPAAVRFLRGETTGDFEVSSLGTDALETRDLNLLYLCDLDGHVVWGKVEQSSDRAAVRVREFPGGSLGDRHPVFRGGGASNAGLLETELGPILVGAHQVRDADGELVGQVVAGRFFDEAMKTQFLERLNIEVDIWPLEGTLPDRASELVDDITGSPIPVADAQDDGTLAVYSTLDNILGSPTLIMRAKFDREITKSGFRIFNFALLSTLATALLILLVLLRLLNSIVLRPLDRLTSHTVDIGRTEDMSVRVGMDRDDEIGLLSREFDSLMDKLAKSREQVISTARLAGMSEIATGVLHNVGNVLNSVNVSTNLVRHQTELLAVQDLEAMTDVLDEHRGNLGDFVEHDERGKQFLPFLSELTRTMSSQRGEMLAELTKLGNGVEHIIELVRSQQSYAGKGGVFEPADLAKELNSAVAICNQAIGFKGDITYERDFEDLPKIPIDKHKLMEILVNLIQNGQQVMEDSGVTVKALVLRVKRDGDEHARIEITDNGPGIDEEGLTRIFGHGYSTRKGGHGFGLHISANAATEMKASLWAESEGLGKGATFILRIPLKAATKVKAA